MTLSLEHLTGATPVIETRRGLRGVMLHGLFVPLPIAGGDDGDPPAGDPPANPPGAGDPPAGDQPPKDDKDFNKEQALATIQKLRGFEKLSKDQARELQQLKDKVAEFEKGQLSEKERLERERDEAKARADQVEQRARERSIRAAVQVEASGLGFADPADAWRFIDAGAIETDDEGEPKGVKKLLEDLLKDKPYLKRAEGSLGVPPTPKPNGQHQTREQMVEKSKEELRASGGYSPF